MKFQDRYGFIQIKRDDYEEFYNKFESLLRKHISRRRILIFADLWDLDKFKDIGNFVKREKSYLVFSLEETIQLSKLMNYILNSSLRNLRIIGVKSNSVDALENLSSLFQRTKYYQNNKVLKSEIAKEFIDLYYYSENFSETVALFVSKEVDNITI